MENISEENKVLYGSEWANFILKKGIREIQDESRPSGQRLLEVLCFLDDLVQQGFWWQAERLQNWIYWYWSILQPPKPIENNPLEGKTGGLGDYGF